MTVRAPIAGTILQRPRPSGRRSSSVRRSSRSAIRPRLWIVAEVYEGDLGDRAGRRRRRAVTLATIPEPVTGRVIGDRDARLEQGLRRAPVYVARRRRARLAGLRPNTYARVAITGPSAAAVSVPGRRRPDRGRPTLGRIRRAGEGAFARRDVSVGSSTDADRVQVTAGLAPGERVVVRGALLLDRTAEQLL